MRIICGTILYGSELWVADESAEIIWYNFRRDRGRDDEPRVGLMNRELGDLHATKYFGTIPCKRGEKWQIVVPV